MQYLSLKKANLLYLIMMILVITLGTWAQNFAFSWGLIFTEIFCIFLPAWFILRSEKLNIVQAVRLQNINANILIITFLLGTGAWFLGSMIDILMVQITGYQTPAIPGIIPGNLVQAGLIFLGLAVAAPICEEFAFRGVLQRSYQVAFSPVLAIIFSGLLFSFFHLRLQGFVGLLPVAVIIGFTYWRTRSIIASSFVHFANNLFSVIVLIQSGLFPNFQLPFPSLQAAMIGILVLVTGILLLIRLTPRPESELLTSDPANFKKQLKIWWPIMGAITIFSFFGALEIMNRSPINYLPLSSSNIPDHLSLKYEIRHKGNQKIGFAECRLSKESSFINLECKRSSEAFEIQVGNSYFNSLAGSTEMKARWDTTDLALISLEQKDITEVFSNRWQIEPYQGAFRVHISNTNGFEDEMEYAENALITEEWPFRLMGISFDTQNTWVTSYLEPFGWREKTNDNGPVLKSNFLLQSKKEMVEVPAGLFEAWKIQLMNGQAAWYSTDSPHVPLKIEGNVFDYYLIEQQ